VGKESNLLVEDYREVFRVVSDHCLQVPIEHSLALSKGYEEEVKDCVYDKRDKETVLSAIVSHEEGVNAQLHGVDQHQRSGVEGEKGFIRVEEIDDDPDGKEQGESHNRDEHS
jgi:hypothetical protein